MGRPLSSSFLSATLHSLVVLLKSVGLQSHHLTEELISDRVMDVAVPKVEVELDESKGPVRGTRAKGAQLSHMMIETHLGRCPPDIVRLPVPINHQLDQRHVVLVSLLRNDKGKGGKDMGYCTRLRDPIILEDLDHIGPALGQHLGPLLFLGFQVLADIQ